MGDSEYSEEMSTVRSELVYDKIGYAMMLDAKTIVPEWSNQLVSIVLEQTIAFTQDKVIYLGGRQTDFYLIK